MTSADHHRAAAQSRAEALATIMLEIGPAQPLRAIADELNARQVPTDRGGIWHPATVARVLRRLGIAPGIEVSKGRLRLPPPRSIHAVVCSPPYANQRSAQYGGISETDYPAFTVDWMSKFKPLLVDNGNVGIVIRAHRLRDRGTISDYVYRTILEVRDNGWFQPEELVWDKPDGPPGGYNQHPRWTFEHILWFSNGPRAFCNAKENGRQSTNLGKKGSKGDGTYDHGTSKPRSGLTLCRDVVSVPVGLNAKGHKHPAPYPVRLAEWIIKLMSPHGGMIADPFLGSGSTALAARNTGRRFLGTDIKDEYVEIAQQRLRAIG